MMTTTESIAIAIAAVLLGVACVFGAVRCNDSTNAAVVRCVTETKQPLECERAFRGSR